MPTQTSLLCVQFRPPGSDEANSNAAAHAVTVPFGPQYAPVHVHVCIAVPAAAAQSNTLRHLPGLPVCVNAPTRGKPVGWSLTAHDCPPIPG